MSEITRRSFLKQSGTTAAAAGALIATPKMLRSVEGKAAGKTAAARTTAAAAAAAREVAAAHNIVVHIPDTRRDEARLLVGQREVVLHDRDLVARLARAAD